MKNRHLFFFVDVFAETKYSGNPLAVFLAAGDLPSREMQRIAREIHFSETAFVLKDGPVHGGFPVRIFTPEREIPFAGHPVLGTAFVIRERLEKPTENRIILNLSAGLVPVDFRQTGEDRPVLWMEQPEPEFGVRIDLGEVAEVLGIGAASIDTNSPVQIVSTGLPHLVVPLRGLEVLKGISLKPDLYAQQVGKLPAKAILAFSKEPYSSDHDLAVRMFAPFYGIPEDPATGSGNGCLAAYLVRHAVIGDGPLDIQTAQGIEIGRPSRLFLKAEERNGRIRVRVGGRVVPVAEGVWGGAV